MEDDLALAGAPRQVDLRHILDIFIRETSQTLNSILESLPEQLDADKKRRLLLFLHCTKQRLLRLIVVSKWASKARVIAQVGRILDVAARQTNACRDAADQLAYLHEELEGGHVPAYDVPSALTVLRTGTYGVLPSCIKDLAGPPEPPPPAQQAATLRLMDHILHATLLQEDVPAGVSIVSIKDAVATLQCSQEWESKLTLVPAPPVTPAPHAETQSEKQPVLEGSRGEGTEGAEQVEREPAADVTSAPADAAEPVPMVTDTELEPSPAAIEETKGALGQDWRWRVLTADVLPACSRRDTIVAPSQASQLSGAVEIRMWSAADAQQQRRVTTAKPEDEPGSSAQHEAAAKECAEPADAQQKPLHILHGILRDVASRLALNEAVVWVRNAAKAPPWAKLLRVEKSLLFSMGVRVSYWLDIPVVSPDALLQLLKEGPSADHQANHPSGAASQKGSGSHVPPALEIGIAESGQLAVLSAPALPLSHAFPQPSALELALDFASLDTESMLLRAATANAAVQLGALQAHLSQSAVLNANSGSVSVNASPAAQLQQSADGQEGASVATIQSPVLVLSSRGEAVLEVSMHLRTGRMQLKLPPQQAHSLSHESGAALLLKKEQTRLATIQSEVLRGPSDMPGGKALHAAQRMAGALELLWVHLNRQQHFSRLLAAAEQLGLHKVQLPPHILQAVGQPASTKANPGNLLALALPLQQSFPPGLNWSQDGALSVTREASHAQAASVQLFLMAQLGHNLAWQLRLLTCSCSASLLPIKALSVKEVPSAQPLKAAKLTMHSSSSMSASQRKRKRPDVAEGALNGDSASYLAATEISKPTDGAAAEDRSAAVSLDTEPDQVTWDIERPAGLQEVVRWSTDQQAWPLLQSQLQALGMEASEEIQFGEPSTTGLNEASYWEGHVGPQAAQLPNGNAHVNHIPMSNGTIASKAGGVHASCQRMLSVPPGNTLQLLDALEWRRKPGTECPASRVAFLPGDSNTAFAVKIDSTCLAGLPSQPSCPQWADATALHARSISQSSTGAVLRYDSASGHTVGHALADLHCIMRLHMSVVRMQALMRARAQSASTSAAGQHDSSAAPAARPNESAQLLQSTVEPSKASETPAVKLKRRLSGADDMQEVQIKRSKHEADISINGQPHDREQHNASDIDTQSAPVEQQANSPLWRCQHSSQVSIASTGCASAHITVAPNTHLLQDAASLEQNHNNPTLQAAGKEPASIEGSASALPQLRVALQWSCGPSGGSQIAASASNGCASAQRKTAAPVHQPRCHISSEPCIHESAAQELAAMAEATQEELLLDALSICGTPLAVLGQMLAPAALLDLDLLPEEVALEPVSPPYKYLLVCKVSGRRMSYRLHFLANGLVWLSLDASQDQQQMQLLQELMCLPKVHTVEGWRADGGAGVWVEHSGLRTVLRHVLRSLAA